MKWYIAVLQNYLGFRGRARRREFWIFFLASTIVFLVLLMVDNYLGTIVHISKSFSGPAPSAIYSYMGSWTYWWWVDLPVLSGLYALAVFLPSLAVEFRRLHDTDRSAWWLLIGLVPFIGVVVLLVFFLLDGTPGPNRFGSEPEGRQSVASPDMRWKLIVAIASTVGLLSVALVMAQSSADPPRGSESLSDPALGSGSSSDSALRSQHSAGSPEEFRWSIDWKGPGAPRAQPVGQQVAFSDGIHTVGRDILEGRYETDSGGSCVIKTPFGGDGWRMSSGHYAFTLRGTFRLETSGGCIWTRTGD